MGYGKRALQQLIEYYSGNITSLNEDDGDQVTTPTINGASKITDEDLETSLIEESFKPRKNLPPLLL